MEIRDFQSPQMLSNHGAPKAAPGPDQEAGTPVSDGFVGHLGKGDRLKADLYKLMSAGDVDGRVIKDVATRQFADSYGRVTHLALMLTSYANGETREQMLNAYKELFTKMEPDTKFSVVAEGPQDRKDLEELIKNNNVPNPERINIIDSKCGNNTVWARDMMVPLFIEGDDQHTALLEQSPFHNWHGNDSQVPSYITEANPSIILDKEPRLITDGGEVMANTKESFVGFYSIAATAEHLAKLAHDDEHLRDKLFKYYETSTGNKIHEAEVENLFPYKFEPAPFPSQIHHHPFTLVKNPEFSPAPMKRGVVSEGKMYEDMAIKLFERQFGKPVTVMGADDPATPHPEEPATDHMDMGLTPVDDQTFFLGDVNLARDLLKNLSPADKKVAEQQISNVMGKQIRLDDLLKDTRNNNCQEDFDGYRKTLTSKGYNVISLPHLAPDHNNFGPPYLTYNNCLMERFDKDGKEFRRVFLPVYGISALDDYAIKQFQSQGFEVHPLPLDKLAAYWGALRCTTNWLERSPKG
jgi:hypothetical protein